MDMHVRCAHTHCCASIMRRSEGKVTAAVGLDIVLREEPPQMAIAVSRLDHLLAFEVLFPGNNWRFCPKPHSVCALVA